MRAGVLAISDRNETTKTLAENDAVRALYERWRPRVFDVALRRLGNLEEAEGVCQEALFRTLQGYESGRVEHFGAYAMRTAVNLATDRFRRRRFHGELEDVEQAVPFVGESGAAEHSRLRQAVAELPTALREVVMLRYEEELSFAEIATALGMSKNAVFARHGRALDQLRAAFARRRS